MDSVLGAEVLKTRKRWLPYILFLVTVVGALIIIWLGGYGEWHDNDDPGYAADGFRTFAFPYSIPALLDSGQFWGAFLVSILAASVVGTEYGWGTMRQVLIRGRTRTEFLALKLAAISLICAVGLLITLGIGILLSFWATSVADASITLDVQQHRSFIGSATGDSPSVPELALMVLRAGYCIIPYGMFAFMLAVLARSSTLGIVSVIIFLFAEAIVIAILESVGGVGADLRDFSIGHNVNALVAQNRIGEGDYGSIAPRELPRSGEVPDPNLAALILTMYSAGFCAIAFYVFNRRDVTG